ncbi:MAG: hypothetical protein ABW022_11590 [Actinoplanes sp.]
MANTTEMLRIMRHAAARLEQEDAQAILPDNYRQYSDADDCRERALSADMAMTYASVVLRMVAAAIDDEQEPSSDRHVVPPAG